MSWSLDQIEEKGSKYPTFARKPNCQAERMIGSQDSRLSRLGIISSTYSPLNGVTAANYSKVESVSETQEVWFPPGIARRVRPILNILRVRPDYPNTLRMTNKWRGSLHSEFRG